MLKNLRVDAKFKTPKFNKNIFNIQEIFLKIQFSDIIFLIGNFPLIARLRSARDFTLKFSAFLGIEKLFKIRNN